VIEETIARYGVVENTTTMGCNARKTNIHKHYEVIAENLA
jgi:hypothetical protein